LLDVCWAEFAVARGHFLDDSPLAILDLLVRLEVDPVLLCSRLGPASLAHADDQPMDKYFSTMQRYTAINIHILIGLRYSALVNHKMFCIFIMFKII
jgi:hypothetical protein